MSRYIDADALKANCDIIIGDTTIGRRDYVMFHEIDSAPSIDIVYCRECKYGEYREDYDDYECHASGCGLVYDADFFCADGKRKLSEKPSNSKERSSE